MKTKLLSILALLLVAVSGAWAQDTYTVTFKANGNTVTVENVTLPKTFSCDLYMGNGELDLIIQELYGFSGGYCDDIEAPNSSGSENVTCGIIDDENHFITVSAPFDGTATVTGKYMSYNSGHFTYSLEITCSQPAPTGVEINETNFPDAKFREFLKGQTYGTDGIITDAERATVTSMDVPFSDIVSMKGIEYFTALERLICANGKISQLDLTKNTALQELNCNSNQLTTLDLSQNTALVGLFCADNKLTALDLRQNTALKRLLCAKNQLATLDLSQNTAMEIVECYENKLTTLNLTNNTALQDLKCNANQLTTLNITKCTAMILLECADNKLTELDLTENTKLQSLHCAGNKLTELNLKQNTVLTNLNCSRNQLTALDLTKNTELTDLNCSVNQIKGTAMDALIESLPKNTDETNFYLYVIDGTNNGELNAMTAAQAAAVKAKGWTAYAFDGDDWKEYTGPATYTTSVNIEQLVLDNGVKYDITKDFIDSYIEYASINALDTLNDLENKAMRNEPYLGLKLKTAGAYIKVLVKKGSTLNVKLGAVKEALGVSINGTAQEAIAATDEGTTYSYEATDADAEVVFTTASNKTVVFKQIMIDEPLADITLPEPGAYLITVATPENGTAAVDWADKKYRTPVGAEVTVTATPAEGYELNSISVTGAISNTAYIVTDGKFTMPAEEVTVSASFKEESYVKLSDYAFDVNSEFIDDPDYGKEIEAKLTYKSELTGSYQNEFTLNATFNYEVVDKNGTVVTSGTQSPFSVSSNAVTIYIDGLEEGTEYTIRLTSAKVTDFNVTTFEEEVVFNQVTDLSGAPLASATFTTQQITGIDGINADEAVKADGKYVEDGKIVIYRNGAKYTVGGKKMK